MLQNSQVLNFIPVCLKTNLAVFLFYCSSKKQFPIASLSSLLVTVPVGLNWFHVLNLKILTRLIKSRSYYFSSYYFSLYFITRQSWFSRFFKIFHLTFMLVSLI